MKSLNENVKAGIYMRVGRKEQLQLNFYDEEINETNNQNSNEKYAIYIRTNIKESITNFDKKKDELLQFAKDNKINVNVIYSDFGFSGKVGKRIALEKMLNDIKSGKINGIIVKNFEQLIRDNLDITHKFLEQLKQNGAKIIVSSDMNLRNFNTMDRIINNITNKEFQDFINKKQKEIISKRRKKIKER